MLEKKLPHNTEAEKSVLGAMIRWKTLVPDAIAKLEVEDFFEENENHRAIFGAMVRLYNRGEPIDPQTITNELINSKELDVSGGPEYLMELSDSVITGDNFEEHVQIVSEHSLLREFLVTLDEIQHECYTQDINQISDFISTSEKKITKVTEKRKIGDFQKADEVAKSLSKELANLKSSANDSDVTGTATGFPRLNSLTHGFQKGELIVLAARPGVGKTALSLNLAYNAATHQDRPVAYFSLEMPANMLFKRLVSADSDIEFDNLITGYGLDAKKRLRLQQACDRIGQKKIYVDETSGIKLLDLVAKCRKLASQEPDLGLIVVDYIGLITTSSKHKAESRQLEVQMISQTLKKLALDLKVPIIAVAQLNRNVEERGGEPQLSDLRESGSLEQDADIVLMLQEKKLTDIGDSKNQLDKHNHQVEEAAQKVAGAGGEIKLVNLFVRKNRSGRTGTVPLLFKRNYCRFDSLSEEAERKFEEIESESVNYLPTGE